MFRKRVDTILPNINQKGFTQPKHTEARKWQGQSPQKLIPGQERCWQR